MIVHYERTGPMPWLGPVQPDTFPPAEAESWPNLDALIQTGYVAPVEGPDEPADAPPNEPADADSDDPPETKEPEPHVAIQRGSKRQR